MEGTDLPRHGIPVFLESHGGSFFEASLNAGKQAGQSLIAQPL